MVKKLIIFGLLFSLLPYGIAVAENTDAELERIRLEIQKQQQTITQSAQAAKRLNAEVTDIRKKIVAAARTVTEYEASLNELEKQAVELEDAQTLLRGNLKSRTKQMTALVSSLEILATRPSQTTLGTPFTLKDSVNSALLTKSTINLLDNDADFLQTEMARLASLKIATRAKYSQIKAANLGLAEKQKQLSRLIAQKNAQQKEQLSRSKTAAKKQEQLSKKAKSLEDLLIALEKEKAEKAAALQARQEQEAKNRISALEASETFSQQPAPPKLGKDSAFERAKGFIAPPVTGEITARFGEANENGMHNKGINIKSRSGAQVISPYDGVVLFAGYFKGYGKLLIIEHSKSYYTLLSGLDGLETEEGQALLAGEPVGTMAKSGNPSLYMELRKDGTPINPVPWLANKT